MQCSSCRAPNKDEAKYCAECGKPLVFADDERQIEWLVEYLISNWFDEIIPDGDSKRRMRDAARVLHAKWKDNPRIEDVKVEIEADEIDETFDGDELTEIFSGREAAERAEDKRRQAEDDAREREADARRSEEKRLEKKKEAAQSSKFGGIVTAVIALASVGVFVYAEIAPTKHKKHEEEEPAADKHDLHRSARTTTTTTTTTTVPDVVLPVAIASCTCVSRANGKNTFVLEHLADGSGPWHVQWEQVSGFASMRSGFWLGASDAGAATSIPRGTTRLHAVMACENDIVAVVAGDVASAWTGTDRGELLWTRPLPAPYAFPSDAGTEDIACAPPLGVSGNVFTVPLAKGKTIALSIRDGSISK
jgi:hypothetical protein